MRGAELFFQLVAVSLLKVGYEVSEIYALNEVFVYS